MDVQILEKANEISELIKKNEKAIKFLQKYSENGGTLYSENFDDFCYRPSRPIPFEAWEIRLMINHKKERVKALKTQLERL